MIPITLAEVVTIVLPPSVAIGCIAYIILEVYDLFQADKVGHTNQEYYND